MAFVQPKRKSPKATYIVGIIFGLLLAIIIFVLKSDVMFGKSVDYYDSLEGGVPKKGKYVELEVYAVIGNYAYTQSTTNGIPTGKSQHYIIWLEDGSLISLKTNNKKIIKELNDIADYTNDYLDYKRDDIPKSMKIKGTIGTMDSKIEGYYRDIVIDSIPYGFSPVYLEIDANETPTLFWGLFILFLVVGVGCIFGLASAIKKEKEMNTSGLGGFSNTYTPQTYDPNMFNHTTNGDNIDPNTGNPVLYTGDQGNNGHIDNLSGVDKDSFK